jgi:hypothetical protein
LRNKCELSAVFRLGGGNTILLFPSDPDDMLLAIPHAVTAFVAPWAKLYSHSKPAAIAVTFFHIATLVVGGGLAIALDRSTLRLSNERDARV